MTSTYRTGPDDVRFALAIWSRAERDYVVPVICGRPPDASVPLYRSESAARDAKYRLPGADAARIVRLTFYSDGRVATTRRLR